MPANQYSGDFIGLRQVVQTDENHDRVSVYNSTAEAMPRYAPVKLTGLLPNGNSADPLYSAEYAASDSDQYGVLLQELAPGASGDALLTGCLVVEVEIKKADDGYVIPEEFTNNEGKTLYRLASAAGGRFRILQKPDGTGKKKCLIQAGSGGSLMLGVMTARPNGNGGAGTYREIVVAPDGSWSPIGPEIPVIVPRI